MSAVNDSDKMPISFASIVVAAEDQISCDLAGEAAILNLETGVYYGLNEVGAAIWSMLAEPRRVSEISEALAERYQVDTTRCGQDVLDLLNKLAAHGLIRVMDEAYSQVH